MARKLIGYIRDGVYYKSGEHPRSSSRSHSISQDTLATPLRHPVTGKMYDSKSALLRSYKEGEIKYNVIGNELMSEQPERLSKGLRDDQIVDAVDYAESVLSDSSKHRAWKSRERENQDYYERKFSGQFR